MTAREFLALLQRQNGQAAVPSDVRGIFGDRFFEDADAFAAAAGLPGEARGHLESIVEQYRSRERTTPFEEPVLASMLQRFADELRALAEPHFGPWKGDLAVGSLQLGQVNSAVMRVPGEEASVIAVNWSVTTFIHLMAKAVASFFEYPAPGAVSVPTDLEQALRSNPQGRARFREAVAAHLAGQVGLAPQYWLAGPPMEVASRLTRQAERFVVGHELGHAYAGHLDQRGFARRQLGAVDVDVLDPSHAEEHEADLVGLLLALQGGKKDGMPLPLAFWGIDFFLTCMALAEGPTPPDASHPPWRERREHLRAVMARGDEEAGAVAVAFAGQTQALAEALWRDATDWLANASAGRLAQPS